ncbi:MAG TPA: serine kinase, partial [Candidatus Hydrogenedentes bacterium]|nr:serine kinase [Candidatus Hydrogenedentota bacterium]
MNLQDIARELGLENLTPELPLGTDREIQLAYVSDLLSDVL